MIKFHCQNIEDADIVYFSILTNKYCTTVLFHYPVVYIFSKSIQWLKFGTLLHLHITFITISSAKIPRLRDQLVTQFMNKDVYFKIYMNRDNLISHILELTLKFFLKVFLYQTLWTFWKILVLILTYLYFQYNFTIYLQLILWFFRQEK